MTATTAQIEWVVIIVTSLAVVLASALAIVAVVLSRRALRACIPAPAVRPVHRQMLVVRMLPCDEGEYGVSEIKMIRGQIQAAADFSIKELEGILRGSWKMDPWTTAVRWDHAATSVIARYMCNGRCRLKVRIQSRRDCKIYRWVSVEI